MSVHSFVVLCALLSLGTSATPFRPRGNDSKGSGSGSYFANVPQTNTPAPRSSYGNRTSSSTSASASASVAPLSVISTPAANPSNPIPVTATGFASEHARPRPTNKIPVNSPASNNTGPPCRINIPSANIDWWYAATYEHAIATLTSFQANDTDGSKYLTTIPITETFDVKSALETDLAFTQSESYDSDWGWTLTFEELYTVNPSAVITSVITRTAAVPLPTSSFAPFTDARFYDLAIYNLSPATLAITGAPNATFVATSATPFLYFTEYEMESKVLITAEDGHVDSSTSTVTIILPTAYAQPYWLKGIEDYALAKDTVPEEFLQQIPQSACSAGSFQATVTVLIVVNLVYINRPIGNPFLIHIESTATGFGTITDEPRVVILNTSKPTTTTPPPVHPPIVEITADGFLTSSTSSELAVHHTATMLTNAGSNVPQGVKSPEETRATVGSIGTAPIVIGPSSVVIVGSRTLQPGGPPVTIGGNSVSLALSATAIVVGGKTSELPQVITAPAQARPPPILTIGSSTLTGNAATQFFIAPGQTLTAGGTATIDGTVVSLAPSASFIVIGGSTQVLPTIAPTVTARPEINFGLSTVTANPGNPGSAPTFVISGQTLVPSQVITVDGTTVSLAPSGSFIVINGATSTLSNPAAAQIAAPPLTIGNIVFTALPGSGTTYIIGTHTLTPGGALTVADTTISLAPSATVLVINGKATSLPGASKDAITTNPPLLTIGSQTFTAAPGTGTTFLIGFGTLTPGGTITVDGTTIVLAPGATELTYASSGKTTVTALFPATTTRSQLTTGIGTSEASAGATALNGEVAVTTSQKGAGWSMKEKAEVDSWGFSLMVGILGLMF